MSSGKLISSESAHACYVGFQNTPVPTMINDFTESTRIYYDLDGLKSAQRSPELRRFYSYRIGNCCLNVVDISIVSNFKLVYFRGISFLFWTIFRDHRFFQKAIKLYQICFFVKLKRTGQPANRLSQPNKLIELIMVS